MDRAWRKHYYICHGGRRDEGNLCPEAERRAREVLGREGSCKEKTREAVEQDDDQVSPRRTRSAMCDTISCGLCHVPFYTSFVNEMVILACSSFLDAFRYRPGC